MIRALLDADVLYPLPLRDTLLSAAVAGCFQPLWSRMILDEVTVNLIADRRMTPDQAGKFLRIIDQHFEDALVEGFEERINEMTVHPQDRHVAAAAVHARAALIVTQNIRDYRRLPAGVTAMTPDRFLLRLMAETPRQLADALSAQSARLKNPPISVAGILALLKPVTPDFAAAWLIRL